MPVTAELRARAREIAESLVLSGFLTPRDDDIKSITGLLPDYYVHDLTLLIPVANELSELNTTSVWSVLDGAIYAKTVKRKAGVLGRFTDGKDVYVVFNAKTRKAYLFHSDLAREAITELDGEGLNVQLDDGSFEYGLRVSAASDDLEIRKPELFNTGSKRLQEEFLAAWLHIGARNIDQIDQMLDTQVHPRAVDESAGVPMNNLKLDDTENTNSGSNTSHHHTPGHTMSHLTAPFHHGTHGKTDDPSRGASTGGSGDLNRGSNTACQEPGHTRCPMCDSTSHSQAPFQQGTYGGANDQSRGAYAGESGDLNRGANTSHQHAPGHPMSNLTAPFHQGTHGKMDDQSRGAYAGESGGSNFSSQAPGHSRCAMCDSASQNTAPFHQGMSSNTGGGPLHNAHMGQAGSMNSGSNFASQAPGHTSCPMCDSTSQNPALSHQGMSSNTGYPSQYAKMDDAQHGNSTMDTAHRAPEHTSSHMKSPFTHGAADSSTKPHGQEWFGREPGRAAP